MLGAIATQMTLFVTCIAINFAEISHSSSSSSPLHVSSLWSVPPLGHSCGVHFFASSDASSCSSCQCVHCIWVGQHMSGYPSSWTGSGCAATMRLQSCLHVNVVLLTIDGCLFPLLVGGRSIKFEDLLV